MRRVTFPKLDANYFHREFIGSKRLCPLDDNVESEARVELSRLLKSIYELEDGSDCQLGPPPSFYALLLADGDRLGRLVGELGGQSVGEALSAFIAKVPKIVSGARRRSRSMRAVTTCLRCCPRSTSALLCGLPVALLQIRLCGRGCGGQGDALRGCHVRSCPIAAQHGDHRVAPVARRCRQGRQWAGFVGCRRHEAWRTAFPVGNDVDSKAWRFVGCRRHEAWRTVPVGNDVDSWRRRFVMRIGDSKSWQHSSIGVHRTQVSLRPSIYRIRETLVMLCGWPHWEARRMGRPANRLRRSRVASRRDPPQLGWQLGRGYGDPCG